MKPRRLCHWRACVVLLQLATAAGAGEVLEFGRLGKVTLYRPAGPVPGQVVLMLSDEAGWAPAMAGIASHLAARGMLVAGIDTRMFRAQLLHSEEGCTFTAGDLESFAHFLEGRLQLARYVNPVVVGSGLGAALAYVSLVQAPAGTFKGAVSLDFHPDLAWPRPLCAGPGPGLQAASLAGGRQVLKPATRLQDRWLALCLHDAARCDTDDIRKFVAAIPGAQAAVLPDGAPGSAAAVDDLTRIAAAVEQVAGRDAPAEHRLDASIADLPLVEVPASGRSRDLFAIMLSGDGGWAGLDRGVAAALAARGIPVVGWDSLRYFWTRRTPEGAAGDLARIVGHYALAWKKSRAIVIGYSMGADVMPFLANRLPAAVRPQVDRIALLGPGTEAFFEFHVDFWLGRTTGGRPIAPELARLPAARVLCVSGREEPVSLCRQAAAAALERVELPGDHHFGGAYDRLGKLLADFAGS